MKMIKLQITRNGIVLFLIGLMVVLLISCLGYSDTAVYLANLSLMLFYVIVLVFTFRRHGFFSVQCLFLISLCVFSFFGIFLSVIGVNEYRDAQEWVGIIWNNTTAKTVSVYYIMFLAIFSFICADDKAVGASSFIRNELGNSENVFFARPSE